ncbi:HD domain-containing protein [Treponema sp. OMZ 840]|uniref:Ppx/GppA phosphatase family protein n=1 Tax=Treponema sp. OMZ 840 TaxID=244313 RepID=UPI003D8AD916
MKTLEAVIEIGSTGIRLMVCELSSRNSWTTVDRSEQPVSLGRDVFTAGSVSRESLLQCLRILNRFREQLAGWKIEDSHITVIATSALREARNRDTIVDRIQVKTGFHIDVINGIEENRLIYLAVLEVLRQDAPGIQGQNSLILEIGGGSTEIMLFDQGKVAAVHSLRLGTVIIEQYIKSMTGSRHDTRRFLEDFIKNAGGNLNTEANLKKIRQFITIGSEMQIAAKEAGQQIGKRTRTIDREKFTAFVDEIQQYSPDECMARFKIGYSDAKSLPVGLLTYKLFIELTNVKKVIVFDTTIREGLLLSKLPGQSTLQQDFASQIIASAVNIGKKYRIDEKHAQYVRKTALHIYDSMESELGLDKEARLLLEVAAILHDIGMFIRGSDHQLHSQYIISHSDIFGLTKDRIQIVALVARYHKGSLSLLPEETFFTLARNDRTLVLKLAAILRVADALDRSHSQHITDITILQKEDTLIFKTKHTYNTNLEKTAIAEKGDLFESVFGYTIIIT